MAKVIRTFKDHHKAETMQIIQQLSDLMLMRNERDKSKKITTIIAALEEHKETLKRNYHSTDDTESQARYMKEHSVIETLIAKSKKRLMSQ